jgi:hypothetical protein
MDAGHFPRAAEGEQGGVDEATMARTPGSAALLRLVRLPCRRGSRAIADPSLVGSVEDSSRQLLRRVIDQRGALRYNWRVADEDANSVRNDNVQGDPRFDEVIHRFTKVGFGILGVIEGVQLSQS